MFRLYRSVNTQALQCFLHAKHIFLPAVLTVSATHHRDGINSWGIRNDHIQISHASIEQALSVSSCHLYKRIYSLSF